MQIVFYQRIGPYIELIFLQAFSFDAWQILLQGETRAEGWPGSKLVKRWRPVKQARVDPT